LPRAPDARVKGRRAWPGRQRSRLGHITERQLKHALSLQLRIAFVDLDRRSIDPGLAGLISERVRSLSSRDTDLEDRRLGRRRDGRSDPQRRPHRASRLCGAPPSCCASHMSACPPPTPTARAVLVTCAPPCADGRYRPERVSSIRCSLERQEAGEHETADIRHRLTRRGEVWKPTLSCHCDSGRHILAHAARRSDSRA
jgi:hypothetical protein